MLVLHTDNFATHFALHVLFSELFNENLTVDFLSSTFNVLIFSNLEKRLKILQLLTLAEKAITFKYKI